MLLAVVSFRLDCGYAMSEGRYDWKSVFPLLGTTTTTHNSFAGGVGIGIYDFPILG